MRSRWRVERIGCSLRGIGNCIKEDEVESVILEERTCDASGLWICIYPRESRDWRTLPRILQTQENSLNKEIFFCLKGLTPPNHSRQQTLVVTIVRVLFLLLMFLIAFKSISTRRLPQFRNQRCSMGWKICWKMQRFILRRFSVYSSPCIHRYWLTESLDRDQLMSSHSLTSNPRLPVAEGNTINITPNLALEAIVQKILLDVVQSCMKDVEQRVEREFQAVKVRRDLLSQELEAVWSRRDLLSQELSREREWIRVLELALRRNNIPFPQYPPV